MDKKQRAEQLRRAQRDLERALRRLNGLEPHLELACDRHALRGVICDLIWGIENTGVIALHQRGRKLGDDMGYYFAAGFWRKHPSVAKERCLPRGMSIERANRRELGVGSQRIEPRARLKRSRAK